jgi:hypothetical protein
MQAPLSESGSPANALLTGTAGPPKDPLGCAFAAGNVCRTSRNVPAPEPLPDGRTKCYNKPDHYTCRGEGP